MSSDNWNDITMFGTDVHYLPEWNEYFKASGLRAFSGNPAAVEAERRQLKASIDLINPE